MTTETTPVAEPVSTEATLSERGKSYGNFSTHAALSQVLKNTLLQHYYATNGGNDAPQLAPHTVEALTMICHKLARIANGNPSYIDTWRDIAGYAKLEADILSTTEGATDAVVSRVVLNAGEWKPQE